MIGKNNCLFSPFVKGTMICIILLLSGLCCMSGTSQITSGFPKWYYSEVNTEFDSYSVCGISNAYNKKYFQKQLEEDACTSARVGLVYKLASVELLKKSQENHGKSSVASNSYEDKIKGILSSGNYENIVQQDGKVLSNLRYDYENADYQFLEKILPCGINPKKSAYIDTGNNKSILIAEVIFPGDSVNNLKRLLLDISK